MKATGVTRQIDPLGRIVIPKELRKTLNLNESDALEIYTENDTIILKKYAPGCYCCGEIKNLTNILGLNICPQCLKTFKEAELITDILRREG